MNEGTGKTGASAVGEGADAERARRRRGCRGPLVVMVVGTLAVIGAAVMVLLWGPRAEIAPSWVSRESGGVRGDPPREFRYVAFPKGGEAPLLSAPEGERVGSITRAVLVGHDELGREWLPITDRGVPGVHRLADVSFRPPPDWRERVAELAAERRSRGVRFAAKLEQREGGVVRAELEWDGLIVHCTYVCEGEGVKPLAMAETTDKAIAFQEVGRAVVVVMMAGVAQVGVWSGCAAWWWLRGRERGGEVAVREDRRW